uniref:Ion transport domain-containing protein n=1 Tax=Pinguiococcus pyrenoidosus TaxID=172671 RepID=A0A7R9YA12_9STRA|mmetsp:Transcript_12716/g.46947  ORF Transcript_12716/g.46947 Transcript_12716/m.46947 type:complete len:461 (+) Transcript_12716:981-2363(+)
MIPLKNIAGKRSMFLRKVANACKQIDDYRVFNNEVVQDLVEYKWRIFAQRQFFTDALVYGIYVMLFAVSSSLFKEYAVAQEGTALRAFGIIIFSANALLLMYFFLHEMLQIRATILDLGGYTLKHVLKSLQRHLEDPWNIIDLLSQVSMLISLMYQAIILIIDHRAVASHFDHVAIASAATVPLLALNSLYFLQGHPRGGTLVRMIVKITQGTTLFSVILLVIMLGFATSLTLLFSHVDVRAELNTDYDQYTDFGRAMLTVFGFMLSQFDFATMEAALSPELAYLLTVLYLYLVAVVLLNLLIAIMSDKFDEISENARAEATYARACLVLEYEALLTEDVKNANEARWFPKWIQVLKRGSRLGSSDKGTFKRRLGRSWRGKVRSKRFAAASTFPLHLKCIASAAPQISAIKDASFRQLDGLGKQTKSQIGQLKGDMQELKTAIKVRLVTGDSLFRYDRSI